MATANNTLAETAGQPASHPKRLAALTGLTIWATINTALHRFQYDLFEEHPEVFETPPPRPGCPQPIQVGNADIEAGMKAFVFAATRGGASRGIQVGVPQQEGHKGCGCKKKAEEAVPQGEEPQTPDRGLD